MAVLAILNTLPYRPLRAFHLLHPERKTRHSAIAQLAVATPPEKNKNYRCRNTRDRIVKIDLWMSQS